MAGDWSTGKKATPVLRIVEKGKQTEIIAFKTIGSVCDKGRALFSHVR